MNTVNEVIERLEELATDAKETTGTNTHFYEDLSLAISALRAQPEANTNAYKTGFADGYVHGRRSILDKNILGDSDPVVDLMIKGQSEAERKIERAIADCKKEIKSLDENIIRDRAAGYYPHYGDGNKWAYKQILEILEGKAE